MNLKRIFSLLLLLLALHGVAQPPARQREAAATDKTQNGAKPATEKSRSAAALGSIREFPTAATMPQDVVWRRDVYRRVDLRKDANAPLYYPIFPQNGRENLFVYLFHLILRNKIKAYEYTRDANEHFDEAHVVKGKKILDDNHIFYESVDGKMRLNDADLPSEDVKVYFLKESVYYDQRTAIFRTKVTALCPVVVSGTSEFGESEQQQIPLFWVNYEEAAPHLAKLSLMGSNLNNAAEISADDYFATNRYEGDIYKTTNLQDRIIAQYAVTDSAQVKERTRIEGELKEFEDHVWGNDLKPATPDAVKTDSLSAADVPPSEAADTPRRTRRTRRTTVKAEVTTKPETPKPKKSPSSTSYSVRRQRH